MSKGYEKVRCISYKENFEEIEWSDIKVFLFSYKKLDNKLKYLVYKRIEYLWIYNLFMLEGIFFEREFYKINKENNDIQKFLRDGFGGVLGYFNCLALELYFEKEKMKGERRQNIKAKISEKCFFLAL